MLSTIWGFHGGDYEECRLLGCYAVWLLYEPTFRRNITPPSSGWQVLVCSMRQLLVTANVPSQPILVILIMEALHSSETSVLISTTWHNIPEDGILERQHFTRGKLSKLDKWVGCLTPKCFHTRWSRQTSHSRETPSQLGSVRVFVVLTTIEYIWINSIFINRRHSALTTEWNVRLNTI
jgi:hypothetical protein